MDNASPAKKQSSAVVRFASSLVHATCVAFGGQAVLLRGASGGGKSDLALRCIVSNSELGFVLVADDQVCLCRKGDAVLAYPPERLRGQIEVRGIGIIEMDYKACVPVGLLVDLSAQADIPRMPKAPLETEQILGLSLPVLRLEPFSAAAPVKLQLALSRFGCYKKRR